MMSLPTLNFDKVIELYDLPLENYNIFKLDSLNNDVYLLSYNEKSYLLKVYKSSNRHLVNKEVELFNYVIEELSYCKSKYQRIIEPYSNFYITCQPYIQQYERKANYYEIGKMTGKYHIKLKEKSKYTSIVFDIDHYKNYSTVWYEYLKHHSENVPIIYYDYLSKVLSFNEEKLNYSLLQITHGDFHLGNIIYIEDKPLLIDWECATVKPNLCDLSYFLISSIIINKGKEEEWKHNIINLFKGYMEEVNIDERDILNFVDYLLLDRLMDLKVYEMSFLNNITKFNSFIYSDYNAIRWLEQEWMNIVRRGIV
ncbi:phosphotransferase [Evansella clarkii]|uniref:phosphotransferase n=1 Tax=Evansella clarkii TaxID=79879 RepID=UPI000B44E15C|nr:phosphotransferase [Evansella clarkii]